MISDGTRRRQYYGVNMSHIETNSIQTRCVMLFIRVLYLICRRLGLTDFI